ncbi:MAG: Sigma factor AlgU negative regulatory protein [Pseudomonadales bacterium]|nr:Sigma factor AlgU negative regulatory protein [Pseudomonadales bacterium]
MSQMKEPLREMASAVADGEASEFELRRVLDGLDEGELKSLLGRHYMVRSVVRGEATALCPPQVSAAIFAALDAEVPPAVAGARARRRIPLGGVAVAASVCMVAVFGLRALAPAGDAAGAAGVQLAGTPARSLAPLGPPAAVVKTMPSAAVPVGFGPAARVPSVPGQFAGADRLAEERLRVYMDEHVRNAALNTNQGMLPYARAVSDESH